MRCASYSHACRAAFANSKQSGIAWVVFSDQAGTWNAERITVAPKAIRVEVYEPDGTCHVREPVAID